MAKRKNNDPIRDSQRSHVANVQPALPSMPQQVTHIVRLTDGLNDRSQMPSNEGSEFWVPSLPAPVTPAPTNVEPGTAKDSQNRPDKRHILVIDDQPAVSRSLSYLLEALGQNVRAASNISDGLQLLNSFLPEIVICDIAMPGGSGHDLARRIRIDQDLHQPFLIACSGSGSPNDIHKSLSAGFNAHVTKPISLKKLRDILWRHQTNNRPDPSA